MEGPAGCCVIEAARLYGNRREQIREVALQTRKDFFFFFLTDRYSAGFRRHLSDVSSR